MRQELRTVAPRGDFMKPVWVQNAGGEGYHVPTNAERSGDDGA